MAPRGLPHPDPDFIPDPDDDIREVYDPDDDDAPATAAPPKHTDLWDSVRTPPASALKPIRGGRLKGFTDIKPMWRWRRLTELFGPCGIGWKYEVVGVDVRTFDGIPGEVMVNVAVDLYINVHGNHFNLGQMGIPTTATGWSAPIRGYGGSMMATHQREGVHIDDEAFKKAMTDALGSAAKMIGVAADIWWKPEGGEGLPEGKYEAGAVGSMPHAEDHSAAEAMHLPLPQPSPPTPPPHGHGPHTQRVTPSDPDSWMPEPKAVVCECNAPARHGEIRSGKNKGKRYYGCPNKKGRDDPNGCDFFEWDDEYNDMLRAQQGGAR